MAEKTMHHVVIGGDTFELIDEAGREETTALKEDINDLGLSVVDGAINITYQEVSE